MDESTQSSHLTLVHILTVPDSLRFFDGQIRYMQEHNYDIHVITSPGELLDQFGHDQSVKTYAIDMPRRITPLNDLIAIWNLYRKLRQIKPDIVHAHTPKGGLLGTIAAWLARVPVRIYHLRGLPFEAASGNKRRLLKLTEKISCLLAHRVFCNSASNKEVVISEKLCKAQKITVLHNGSSNGVDSTNLFNPELYVNQRKVIRLEYGLPDDAVVIGFVGRIVRDKGVEELIAAWDQIKDHDHNIRLLVIGPFEEQNAISSQTKDIILSDSRICYAGFFKNKSDIPKLYAAMDILVLPSYREGLPNVILEASSMGLPVISTWASGCKDVVVDGETGALIPIGDIDALADALKAYVDDIALVELHGQAARKHVVQHFQPSDIWRAQLQEYRQLAVND